MKVKNRPQRSPSAMFVQYLLIISACTLAACGGGGGDPTASAPRPTMLSAGAYSGTVTATSPRNFPILIVRPAGEVWMFNMTGSSILGFGSGIATETGTDITTTSFRYLSNQSGVLNGEVTGTFRQGLSLGGTISYPSLAQTLVFSSTFRPPLKLAPSDIARTWSGSSETGEGVSVVIGAKGDLTATYQNGCVLDGRLSEGDDNLALLPVQVATNGFCRIPNIQLNGVVYSSSSGSAKALWIGLTKPSKDDGVMIYSRLCANGTTGGSLWSCF